MGRVQDKLKGNAEAEQLVKWGLTEKQIELLQAPKKSRFAEMLKEKTSEIIDEVADKMIEDRKLNMEEFSFSPYVAEIRKEINKFIDNIDVKLAKEIESIVEKSMDSMVEKEMMRWGLTDQQIEKLRPNKKTAIPFASRIKE